MEDSRTGVQDLLSWVHFGDLHIQNAHDENYEDFLLLIDDANQHLAGQIDFAFLPGDNADDGTENQYRLVRQALDRLSLPVHTIPGDHDRKAGSLDLFQRYLEPSLYRAVRLRNFLLLFLNAMDGRSAREFDLSDEQVQWFEAQLKDARRSGLRPLVFTHLYPSELATKAGIVTSLIRNFQVELVEMGHTHYNELANNGQTIYACTRSTGQIEEGPPGFSLTVVDRDVVSWKFKERGPWPFVMITSPADERLITRPTNPSHIVRGVVPIRAKVWGDCVIRNVSCSVNGSPGQPMHFDGAHWECSWDSSTLSDGRRHIRVTALIQDGREAHDGSEAHDEISVLVNQAGQHTSPLRSAIDFENAIGPYYAKGILGTELGPNEKGTKGPWPSWRNK